MTQIANPFQYIADPTKSRAIFNGKLFFGLPDTDPTIPANQKLVRGVQENGDVVNLPQPVATGSGGVPEFQGSPVVLDVSGDYSFTVLDRFDGEVYQVPRVENIEEGSEGFSGVVAIEANTLIAGQTTVILTTGLGANESVFYLASSVGDQGFLQKDTGSGGDYTVTDSTTIELTQSYNAGDVVVARQNDPTGQLVPIAGAGNLFVYNILTDVQAAAVSTEIVAGDVVTLKGIITVNDGLGGDRYLVQLTGPANDGVNFIDLNGTLQLAIMDIYYRFISYAERIATPIINASVLNVDLSAGPIHDITLTENISDTTFLNKNPSSNFATSFTLRVVQDVVGGRSIAWNTNIVWAGGIVPTLTATPDAVDVFGFSNLAGTADFHGFVLGLDFS